MCGRFTLTAEISALQDSFPWLYIPPELAPRYNVAPSQPVAVVPNDGKDRIDFFVWGLIPSWAKDPAIGNRMINARTETLAEKPTFRAPFRRKRCLILTDGFFEWTARSDGKGKTPMYLRMVDGKPFAFAGLWDTWFSPDGSEVRSCTIITTEPNELVRPIHNRMPVILPPSAYREWLTPGEGNITALQAMLKPYPASEMVAYPVSRLVNDPKSDRPEVILPA
ncbi:MAG: SOS response-associated peptidase [Anaerolineales bacterium]|nr:SOS response-associated peptidase [Anaerolineales bacterium]